MTKEKKYLKNEQLPNCYLDVIDYDGTHLGRMLKAKAVQMAQDDGFDLICVAPQADPPVCKIADYGKFIYEMAKKDKMKKKNQKNADLKEIRLSAHISDNDLAIKAKMAKKFNIPMAGDLFDTTQPGAADKIVKLLCNRGMVDPFDDNPMEKKKKKKWE